MKKNPYDADYEAVLNGMSDVSVDITSPLRVPKAVAAEWLLKNRSLLRGGNLHYLAIKDLGLGVCMVKLRPLRKVGTYAVKEFEAHSIPSEFPGGMPTLKA